MDNKVIIIYPQEFKEPIVFEFPLGKFGWDEYKTPTEILEYIFRQCNHVDGSEWIQNKGLRSFSVGDMVVLNGQIWVCCGAGWKEIEKLIK